MKSRSHWLPETHNHDDWVDESWTVDCICGVNYDDGEEMVDCDECGVWVHTRCSRFAKSDKSYVCDKCKNKTAPRVRNESEETEVAEFLVELPTKTLIMDSSNVVVPSRVPVRFCAPMEERVHVQGLPGGDPGLFSKMSSVFGTQLWKSSGYVPKKFNYMFSEFLGEDEGMEKDDDGVGCLLSLSKENVIGNGNGNGNEFRAPSVGLRSSVHNKKKNVESDCPENSVKKVESRLKKPIVMYSGKRKKDESKDSKDQVMKKRVRSTEEGVQRQTIRGSEEASTFSSDAEQMDVSQGKGSKAVPDRLSDDLGECATNLAANECGPDANVTDTVTSNEISKEGIGGEELSVSIPGKEEITGDDVRSCGDTNGDVRSVGHALHKKESVKITASDAEESETPQQTSTCEDKSRPIKKLKSEADTINGHERVHVQLDSTKLDKVNNTTQHPKLSPISTEDCKAIETSVAKSETRNLNVNVVSPGRTSQSNQGKTALEGPSKAKKRPFATKHGLERDEDLHKTNSPVTNTSRASSHCKLVVKSSSTSTSVIPKLSSKDISASAAQNPTTTDSGQKELSGKSTDSMNENKPVRADKMFFRTRKLVKDSSRLNSVSNVEQVAKSQSSLDSKRMLADAQDIKRHSGDSSSSHIESASDVQNKATGSVPPVKGEKSYQSANHSLTRGSVASTNAPPHPNVAATLSDEELALLLHQELNSSPRVPRVPRMRNTGSLPHITSPTATSLLLKRASINGGKDQAMLYKRKNKEFSKDASHGTSEADKESKKRVKSPSSPDKKRRDTGVDPVSRREIDSGSVKGLHSNKVTTSNSLSSSSNDANVQSLSTNRPSSRKASVDGTHVAGRSTNRNLPGLVADVMKDGKRTSCEEQCSADFPTSSSRNRRKNDADSLNTEMEDIDARAKGARSKVSHQEELEFPKGKRNARSGRRLALHGRGIVKRRRMADVVSDDESKSYPNSSDEDNVSSSEEEIQSGGNETSSSSDED